MSLFKIPGKLAAKPNTPQALFDQLPKRGEVKYLWSHQDRLLESFMGGDLHSYPNVALELPTGAGKTLVGLLISEFKRSVDGKRAIYLCPTRQLARQVQAQAEEYGINTVVLVGPVKGFPQKDLIGYQSAGSIAITTYSGLFNTNPAFDSPQVIVCDDAHAAESYVSKLWSMLITREEHLEVFESVVAQLAEAIPPEMLQIMRGQSQSITDALKVDLVPLPSYSSELGNLSDLLRTCLATHPTLKYSWSMLAGHFDSVNVFVGSDRILLRPLVPPGLTHAPFAGADQRIYMSATLGGGGDLERVFGIPKVKRVPMPSDWERRSTGRRLILMPELATDPATVTELVTERVLHRDRSLVLTSDNQSSAAFANDYCKGATILGPTSIEDNLDSFIGAKTPAALVLANRYDGLDLKGDICRQMFFVGLPSSGDLQERFLLQRLGATSLFRGKIRTRLTQGLGRCTRDVTDYALVFLMGNDLLKWISSSTNSAGLPPEIRAELWFGSENSVDVDKDRMAQIAAAFLRQTPDWREADAAINQYRDSLRDEHDPLPEALSNAAPFEIDYSYAMWSADYRSAYEHANRVLESLSGGSELKPYRSLWHYLAACCAYLQFERTGESSWNSAFRDNISRAMAITMGISWLSRLRELKQLVTDSGLPSEALVNPEPVSALLSEWRLMGSAFGRAVGTTRTELQGRDSAPFERGLRKLGGMLGFETYGWSEAGVPDGLWVLPRKKAIVFEAKTEESSDKAIPYKDVRQALTHRDWIVERLPQLTEHEFATVMVSEQASVSNVAGGTLGDLFIVTPEHLLHLFDRAARVLSSIRDRARSLTSGELSELVITEYQTAGLESAGIFQDLTSRRLDALYRRT